MNKMDCKDFDERYWLHAYGEEVPGGNETFLQHLETCVKCQSRRRELDRFRALLTSRAPAEARPEALEQSRERLSARLRAEQNGRRTVSVGERLREWLRPLSGPVMQPVVAFSMLVLGLLIGRFAFVSPAVFSEETLPLTIASPAALERSYIAESVLTGDTQIRDLKVKPLDPASGLVQVDFRATRDYQIQGNPSDDIVGPLLAWAVKNEDNSGARMQSVEELARATELSLEAREALAYALVNDQNEGVRLKALEALGSSPRDELSEQAILKALLKDPNPAVRIRAIDMILSDEITTDNESVLLKALEADSNDYVRMKADQAIRKSDLSYEMIRFGR